MRNAVQPCPLLVDGFDYPPRRFRDVGVFEHRLLGFGIGFPSHAGLQVHWAQLPLLQRVAGSRYEFEYDIPLEDAELILSSCGNNATAKRRHYVLHGGLTWEIDEYDGILKGIVMAEVELDAIDQLIDMPGWIGPEVTAQAPYRKINMLQARQRDLTNPPSET